MTDDLKKRLRRTVTAWDTEGEKYEVLFNPDGPDAADRIEELEAKALKASYAVFLEKGRADEAQDKLARALRALPMPDDLQNEYMIERLRVAIERAEAAEDRIGELEAEIVRLRSHLQWIHDGAHTRGHTLPDIKERASIALEEGEDRG